MTTKAIILSIIIIALFSVVFLSACFINATSDDAHISYRYANNFIAGQGLVWNINERPVEGYTNFLWVLIAAVSLLLKIHPLIISKIIGFFAYMGMIVLPLTNKNIFCIAPICRAFTSLLIAICPVIGYYGQIGMEQTFFAFFVLWAILTYIDGLLLNSSKKKYVAAFLTGLSALIRPEGAGVFGILFLYELYLHFYTRKPLKINFLAVFIFWFIVVWLPYFIWRFNYYGYPFPNTFYAKHTGGGLKQVYLGFRYLSDQYTTYLVLPISFSLALYLSIKSKKSDDYENLQGCVAHFIYGSCIEDFLKIS